MKNVGIELHATSIHRKISKRLDLMLKILQNLTTMVYSI
jgi:hypothetical protein